MSGKASQTEKLLVRAITAAAERLKEHRLTIAEYIRLSQLRNGVVSSGPRWIVAGWVAS